jgi:hypothetical protein
MMHLVDGCVMEGSMVFCQKNSLEHSMRFHGDYIKRCILTHRVSQILLLTRLIYEIKYITANRLFSTQQKFNGFRSGNHTKGLVLYYTGD